MERLLDNVSSAPAEVDCVEHARLLGLDVVEEEEQRVEQVVPPGRQLQPTTALPFFCSLSCHKGFRIY